MLRFLPGPVVGSIAFLLIVVNTLFWCMPLYVVAFARWLSPNRLKRALTQTMSTIANGWIGCNNLTLDLTQALTIEVTGLDGLDRKSWYLVTCNHQSWTDILILQRIFVRHIPMLKFFIKQELIWVPVLGIAWWALDFPFMKRYSARQRNTRPGLKSRDLDTTSAACELFKICPVSVLNFLEGTRVTPEKQHAQNSPFKHLLKPKSGGAALVLTSMEEQIDTLLDVTIVYPGGVKGFWEFLCGGVDRVIVEVEKIAIPQQLHSGSYAEDPVFKRRVQDWISEIWVRKDHRIDRILSAERVVG